MVVFRRSVFVFLNEDFLFFCLDLLGKECGKILYKVKIISMFFVFGDEDNVKCLEVVLVYYILLRKFSKKFCNFF